MFNCEKCMHEEVCDQSSRHMWSAMAGEKECSDFKDRTTYAEVVHGHWIEINPNKDVEGWIEFDYKCSVCSEISLENGNYCPNCGAQMVKERNDAE